MTKTVRPANAGAITRALVAAGFRKAEYHPSGMVRGYGTWTPGVKSEGIVKRQRVRRRAGIYRDGSPKYRWYDNSQPTGYVHVENVHGRSADRLSNEERNARGAETLGRAAEVLRSKGYEVEVAVYDSSGETYLSVCRKDADGDVVWF